MAAGIIAQNDAAFMTTSSLAILQASKTCTQHDQERGAAATPLVRADGWTCHGCQRLEPRYVPDMNKLAPVIFALGVIGCVIAGVVVGLDAPDSEFDSRAADVSETNDYQSLIDVALEDYKANNALTEGAPQQQVVNGWVARDLLQIITRQNEAQADTLDSLVALRVADPPDDRVARLLMLLTVLAGWVALWATLPKMLAATPATATISPQPHARGGDDVEGDAVVVTDASLENPLVPPPHPAAVPASTSDTGTDTTPPPLISPS